MKKRTILLSFLLIVLFTVNVYAADENTGTEDTNTEGWTDFSNAECKLERKGCNEVELCISNIERISYNSFYYYITEEKKEPNIDEENYETLSSKELLYDSDKKELHYYHCEADIELNQDLYLWILEQKKVNGKYEYNFVMKGKKIERITYPKYANVFSDTFFSKDETQIVFNVPWSYGTRRKINLKIGKILDNNILKKIKEDTNTGLESLLQYSKSAKTIYNEKLESSYSNGQAYSGYYSAHGSEVVNLSLENGAYYFMYAELDDENGKYYPVEGITLARASTYESGAWYLFLLGDESFNWDLSDNIDMEKTSNNDKKDSTVATKILPNTGTTVIVATVIFGVVVINAVIVINKYNKFKDVK